MASDPELKDGFTLPLWMKTKPTKEFEPFATSPPAEDSFFFIKYPKTETLYGKPSVEQDFQRVLKEQSDALNVNYNGKEKDWSKHTKPCQDVLHGITPINTAVNSMTSKPKPAGTDDGFKGEGAACGSSIVKVAHQMISSSRSSSQRGFTVASPTEDAEDIEARQRYHMTRRGSKSLPVTPAHSPPGSPNSRRKKNGNRYFTSPFEPVDDASNRSWLTMALLGFKRDLTTSTSTLAEEDALEVRLQGTSLAESVENLGPSPKGKQPTLPEKESTPQQPKSVKPTPFRPKPSELREMNFWSPTSM